MINPLKPGEVIVLVGTSRTYTVYILEKPNWPPLGHTSIMDQTNKPWKNGDFVTLTEEGLPCKCKAGDVILGYFAEVDMVIENATYSTGENHEDNP